MKLSLFLLVHALDLVLPGNAYVPAPLGSSMGLCWRTVLISGLALVHSFGTVDSLDIAGR